MLKSLEPVLEKVSIGSDASRVNVEAVSSSIQASNISWHI
jgi:hypothetical protein